MRPTSLLTTFLACSFVWVCVGEDCFAETQLPQDVNEIVFAARPFGIDGHWYANFGYYADDENRLPYPHKGGQLAVLDVKNGTVRTLIDDADGCVRDPQVDYDAKKVIFAYRRGDSKFFNLYEIDLDGENLRQITSGEFDDIEPTYLPDGEIMFVSTRCQRWVNCWLTPVAVLYRCDTSGENIREISSNNEHDNTPWPLPDGKIIYTRWEYIDRSQVHYHHLWSMNPDGVRQHVFYGNLQPGTTMIDAKPIPNSDKIVASFSPGHGQMEHAGAITVIDPHLGPDDPRGVRRISKHDAHRDPWAFDENTFLAARDAQIVLVDANGNERVVYELPESLRSRGMRLHEPHPVVPRSREPLVADSVVPESETGTLLLMDVYQGRQMAGVERGTIKKLLVLESLPKPINFTGGMEPLTYGGSFTLERVVGTVDVAADGSAHFTLPALRSFFFVALDENDVAVKRMQSFLTVMPGETTTCIGCHEERTSAPPRGGHGLHLAASLRPSVAAVPLENVPDVLDFTRDIQPILDKHCVECHQPSRREGGVSLVGHHTPLYTVSYYTITARSLVADGRNLPISNYPPYKLGSGGSRLVELCKPSHHDVKLSPNETRLVKLWCDTGATYPGTYAALGSGMVGGYAENHIDRQDLKWDEVRWAAEVIERRCVSCHNTATTTLPRSPSDEIGGPPWEPLQKDDVRRRFSRQLIYDLTSPADSLLVRAPLAKSAGGDEVCGAAVFASTDDADYKTLLASIVRTKEHLDTIKRFDMPDFIPRPQYIRELKKYGIIPADADPSARVDTYSLEQEYWRSLWYRGK
ncbi:MAG: hypothetical protein ACRC46_09910 [Thermoguttaceae bacterium]